jgi:hypothetical protein
LLLCTGAGYALIGIKNAWVHAFFSSAYLASLGTAVLILYVMTLPVSDTIQGAYVVAVAMTGIVLGGAATVFKEITEATGCLLGGFCVSMWLLCLQPGGLVTGTSAKVVFIACFTVAAFAFYFSHYTRAYALISMISFAGATVTVLGIDCFSRAGLKEFWAYVWDLNENLFPLGADTYPVTKGIRVETAAIFIIFLAGLVSQLKLWKLIKERRAKRAAERAEGQRNLQEEEENVGRQIERANARERRAWERTYGDGDVRSTVGSGDSGVADVESEKKLRHSNGVSTRPQSTVNDGIEMEEISSPDLRPEVPPKSPTPGLMVSEHTKDGAVTVRVARDDVPPNADVNEEVPGEGEKVWILGPDGEVRLATQSETRAIHRNSRGMTASPEPAVVPLPFKIPTVEEPRTRADDERSSVATFADEDDDSGPANKRHTLVKRLSQGSANLLRSLSQRSRGEISLRHAESTEELVIPRARRPDDDNGSIAATFDDESLDGDRSTVRDDEQPRSMQIAAELADKPSQAFQDQPKASLTEANLTQESRSKYLRPISAAETVATDILNASEHAGDDGGSDTLALTRTATEAEPLTAEVTPEGTVTGDQAPETNKAKSVVSNASIPASLTRATLPRALSRVAMSYRTNEWAKHLSNAETPEPDTLQIHRYAEQPTPTKEAPVPLNVDELQQTAETGVPAPAPSRSATAMSNSGAAGAVSRSNSRQATTGQTLLHIPASVAQESNGRDSPGGISPVNGYQGQAGHVNRTVSSAGLRRTASGFHAQPIAEEGYDHFPSARTTPIPEGGSSGRNSIIPSPVMGESFHRDPIPGVVSYSSPQTLIGKRELLLRNRSQGSLPPSAHEVYSAGIPRAPSAAGSVYDYPVYGIQAMSDDDIPMSQRKELIRQNSLMTSTTSLNSRPPSALAALPQVNADSSPFDSHQPQRKSNLPTQEQRNARLANFRQSVAADLRAGTPVLPSAGSNGRETPLLAQYGVGGSSTSLLPGQFGPGAAGLGLSREGEVQRSIETSRNMILSQKEAEIQRKEAERLEKERGDRAFQESMQRGELLDAHREAMRRMQAAAREG